MKRLFSPASLRIGIFLHLLGGALVIVGVFFFPMVLASRDWNGHAYIGLHPYSEWIVVNNQLNAPLLSLVLDVVLVALPLLSMFSVLGTSTAGLSRKVSSRIVIWRRIAALVGLIMHCLLGAVAYIIPSISLHVEFGAGFGLVLLGFSVMIVSTFLN